MPMLNYTHARGLSIGAISAALRLTELLEREGLLLAEYERWRLALAEEGRASLAITKRIRALERELARKEKALAEAAALLVLKKKVNRLWEGEDDGSDEENER